MEAMMEDGDVGTAGHRAGCVKSVIGVGLGLALGALVGIVVGLVAGVTIAMVLGVL